jgi:hypothetical protein
MDKDTRGKIRVAILVSVNVFIVISMFGALAAADLGYPCAIKGVVTLNGQPVVGATVAGNGVSAVTNGSGSYKLDGVASGSTFTVTASYGSDQASQSVTTPQDGGIVMLNLALTPTASSGSSGNTGSSGSNGYSNSAGTSTITPTPAPSPTINSTSAPVSPTLSPMTATQTSTVSQPTMTATASATMTHGTTSNTTVYLVIGAIVVLALAGAGYVLYMRK